jgi:hypothetical protein
MKSKTYILMQIRELLDTNRGLCPEEIEVWVTENEEKTVYELLTIKKELEETQEYPDISFTRWFRG